MIEKQYRLNKWSTRLLKDNRPLFDWFNDSDKVVDLLNSLNDENYQLKSSDTITDLETQIMKLKQENKELKQQIKDLRIDVLDSIHEAYDIKCNCSLCVIEECVKRVVE